MRPITLLAAALALPAIAADTPMPRPELIDRDAVAGAIFDRDDVLILEAQGNTTLDVTSFLSSDSHFGSGMYKSGPVRIDINEPYGVDEFMYFLEGGVTLTSSDGTVTEVRAGEAVTIPKEWTGTWDTDGYTKIWVIYAEDESFFE